jgi:4-hydroxy-3-polyprenylbenzoate decarboxylase
MESVGAIQGRDRNVSHAVEHELLKLTMSTRGMIIVRCVIKILSAGASLYIVSLVVRAANVTMKERRTLVMLVREGPPHKGHLDLLSCAASLIRLRITYIKASVKH